MGFLKDLVGVAAPIAGFALGGPVGGMIGGAVGNAVGGGAKQSGTQTTNQNSTTTQTLDPRMSNLLYGNNGQGGVFGQYQNLLNQPSGVNQAAGAAGNFAGANAGQMLNNQYAAYNALQQGYQEPAIQAAQAQAAQVNAPSQNNLNLSPAYQNFIYGNAAENPYLKQSLQAGVDQSTQAFNTQLGNLTDTLQRNILPGIRGNAIASGQYGGSRQGIAEGLALSDLSKQATNAAQAFGLGNTAATTGALANVFNQGQDRALSATQGLGGQQYGTAFQNAQFQQQANLANAAARQAADMSNVNSLLQTRGQNSANMLAGAQGTGSLLNQATNLGNADINRLGQLGGILAPFTGVGATTTTTGANSTPLYTNPTANALGGATAALGLYNTFTGDNAIGNSLFKAFGGLGGSL